MQKEVFTVLGLRFTPRTKEEALSLALSLLRERRGMIFTPNAEITLHAAKSQAFLDLLNRADILLPDGVGLSLAARRRGRELPRLPGIDFAEDLLSVCPRGTRLYLLGARPGIAEDAAKELCRRYGQIEVCGLQDGYFPAAMAHAVAEKIRAARPDLLFACLGSPRQEEFIALHRLPCLALGLGGAADVWSGAVKRAPRAFRRAGLEWLWRCLAQPARLGRLPSLAAFSARALLFRG